MARGGQVGGIRSAGSRVVDSQPAAESSLPPVKRFKWEFISSKPELTLSFAERIMHWTPRGTSHEEFPKTKNGSRLDMVRFENSFFGTDDDELAEEWIMKHDRFGMGGLVWLKSDMLRLQRDSEAEAMRQRLAADPDLARQVLKPSENEDFKLPPAVA